MSLSLQEPLTNRWPSPKRALFKHHTTQALLVRSRRAERALNQTEAMFLLPDSRWVTSDKTHRLHAVPRRTPTDRLTLSAKTFSPSLLPCLPPCVCVCEGERKRDSYILGKGLHAWYMQVHFMTL